MAYRAVHHYVHEQVRNFLRDRHKVSWRSAFLERDCDFVEDRGHTFGSDLPDSDKRVLIEFMKTF